MTGPDEFRKQVNELWKNAVDQLEEVKDIVLKSSNKFEADIQRLKIERDRLLKKLGEQTHKLAGQGQVPLPARVRTTIDRLNEVIESLVKAGVENAESMKKEAKTARKKAEKTVKKATKSVEKATKKAT
ncbi:hypothetical protein KAI87_11160, partial [Myxococcota bacterium]|nr:hypothetical protein [Myxococcota bacterium]